MREVLYARLKASLEADRLVALATVVEGPGQGGQLLLWPNGDTFGELGSRRLRELARGWAREGFHDFASRPRSFELDDEPGTVFVEILAPRPRMFVVGAVHAAVPLVGFARTLGYRTLVIDPRTAFATEERFGHADELITEWPDEALRSRRLDEGSYLVLLSHDLKLDLPALEVALRSPARYVGALGSRKTHQRRVDALREKGFTDRELERIHSPVGLDLGGRRAEEIAVAIVAEMVAVSHGRGFRPWTGSRGSD